VLLTRSEDSSIPTDIPNEVLYSFGACCTDYALLDDTDCFYDPHKLVEFFCGRLKRTSKRKKQ
jgi:hypothetical protein